MMELVLASQPTPARPPYTSVSSKPVVLDYMAEPARELQPSPPVAAEPPVTQNLWPNPQQNWRQNSRLLIR